jgi:hypothetical protein
MKKMKFVGLFLAGLLTTAAPLGTARASGVCDGRGFKEALKRMDREIEALEKRIEFHEHIALKMLERFVLKTGGASTDAAFRVIAAEPEELKTSGAAFDGILADGTKLLSRAEVCGSQGIPESLLPSAEATLVHLRLAGLRLRNAEATTAYALTQYKNQLDAEAEAESETESHDAKDSGGPGTTLELPRAAPNATAPRSTASAPSRRTTAAR